MKKFSMLIAGLVLCAICMTGCGAKQPEVLPTYEELAAINETAEVLKEHENIYVAIVCESDKVEDYNFTENVLYVAGDNKVDYHKKTKSATDDFYDYTSSTANGVYYVSPESVMTILETGDVYFEDYTLDLDLIPVGKAYLENDQLVHHAYYIYEAFDEFEASREDYTLYFNKDTKLLEKIDIVEYDEKHEVCSIYTATVAYDVNLADTSFDTTAYELLQNDADVITVDVIVGANTPEQKTYQFLSTEGADVYAIINCEAYELYLDADCTQPITTLTGYEGVESLTLYAVLNDYYQQ